MSDRATAERLMMKVMSQIPDGSIIGVAKEGDEWKYTKTNEHDMQLMVTIFLSSGYGYSGDDVLNFLMDQQEKRNAKP